MRSSLFLKTAWEKANSIPLWMKIMGMAMGMALLVGFFSAIQVYRVASENMSLQLEEKSMAIARERAASAEYYLLVNDLLSLTEILRNTVKTRPDLRYIIVLTPQNEVLAHSFVGGFPTDLLQIAFPSGAPAATVSFRTNEGVIWDSRAPIADGKRGFVRVGVIDTQARKLVESLIASLVLGGLMVIVLGLVLSGLLTWLITNPVNKLLAATCAIRRGDYQVRVNHLSHDEIGNLIDAFNVMAEQLAAAAAERREKEQMRREFLTRIIATQEEERKRIARELHDQTGQALASFMVLLKVLESARDSGEIQASIQQLKQSITEEMDSIHNMALDLRPSVLDDMGIEAALELYVRDFEVKHGIAATLLIIGFEGRRPEPDVETTIYRIVQEAMINAARHARASAVKVILEWREEAIRGIIEDNGVGFEVDQRRPGRLGLYSMEERVDLLGGSFRIDSEPDGGTMVSFSIRQPVKERGEEG